jgi:hypothetical protein
MGRPSLECRLRLTFDRSPVRKSRTPGSARGAGGNFRPYRDNFLRPTSYINQSVSLARRRVIHVQRVAALRDLISAA